MRGSVRAAAALGVGYVLGRNRRLRTAAVVAAATAIGGKGVGRMAVQRGMKMIGSTEVFGKLAPQLGEITETVRGDLLDAGKAAAATAISNRVDSLTDSIHDRAERLRNPGEAVAGAAGEAAGTARQAASSGGRRTAAPAGGATPRPSGRRGAAASDQDEYQADLDRGQADDYEDADDYDDTEPDEDTAPDDYEDIESEGEDGQPDDDGRGRARAATARQRPAARRSPVSRARR
jgi:hypothetical protein